MSPHRILTALVATLCICLPASAQQRTGIAFYDLDKFHDTIPSRFYNDDDYTPTGKYEWDGERYERKIKNTVKVIDSMGMDFVALAGVETEQIVRDITTHSTLNYCYIHRTQNTLDGMDLALLYFGDRFLPDRIESGRGYLYAEGSSDGQNIGIIVSSESKYAEMLLAELRETRSDVKYIVLGRFGKSQAAKYGMRHALSKAETAGRGNVCYGNGWAMRDGIYTDMAFEVTGGDVFARRWMMDIRRGKPAPTFDRLRYTGGFGRSLPIFIYMKPLIFLN